MRNSPDTSAAPAILYVDDEHSNRLVFERTFEDDFRIITANDGEEALGILAANEIAVLVTDQRMPGMSGNDLLLVAKRDHPLVVRVIITAYADLDPILHAVNEGLVARYLVKPWDRQQLKGILHWGLEAFGLGQSDSTVQGRLLNTERLATLGTITAAIAHDMSQPLSCALVHAEHLLDLVEALPAGDILGASVNGVIDQKSRIALRTLLDDLPETALELDRSVALICELARGMQQLSKPASRDHKSECCAVVAVKQAIAVCRQTARVARIDIVFDGPDAPLRVQLAPMRLLQVLINLVSNGVQAMERQDATEGGRLDIRLEVRDGLAQFVISDNGAGMSDEEVRNSTKPFYTTRDAGTGLGLAQCRRIVEGAGSELLIKSIVAQGTSISFKLPVA